MTFEINLGHLLSSSQFLFKLRGSNHSCYGVIYFRTVAILYFFNVSIRNYSFHVQQGNKCKH